MNSVAIAVWSAVFLTCCCNLPVNADDVSSGDRVDRIRTISQTLSDEIPLVIAHRGASGYLPEHTTEAAAFAHALGADYIEQDVVLSKDGVAVVLHDVTLNATTNVADVFPDRAVDGKYFVFDFTLEELRQLAVSERHGSASGVRFPKQLGRFRIATFEEHIQLITGLNKSRKRNAGLYVEIKQPALHRKRGLDPSTEVLRLLKKYGYESAEDRLFVQCFEADEILRIRSELHCRLPLIQLLTGQPTAEELAETAKVADGVGVPISAVLTDAKTGPPVVTKLVETAHQHVLMVHVWTFRTDDLPEYAESPEALLDLLVREARVDGIFADQPDVVLSWRKAVRKLGGIRGPFHLLHGRSEQPTK